MEDEWWWIQHCERQGCRNVVSLVACCQPILDFDSHFMLGQRPSNFFDSHFMLGQRLSKFLTAT